MWAANGGGFRTNHGVMCLDCCCCLLFCCLLFTASLCTAVGPTGEVKLARLRKAPAPGSTKGAGGLYWRYQLDVLTCRVLLEAGRSAGGGGQEASVAGGAEAPSTCSTAQGGGC